MEQIVLNPVGMVSSEFEDPNDMPLGGTKAVIQIFPEYVDALKGIEENSHIWIICWFHKAPRDILRTVPAKVNPDLPEYGVFGLRAFARPNPIGLSLVELERVEGDLLYVRGLDAIGGTPVLDIKPYYENDIVFSPATPYIKGKNREMRQGMMKKQAFIHHREECRELYIAVRMAIIAEEYLGKLNSDELKVAVTGPSCLGDCIQGITRARLANPARFLFNLDNNNCQTIWSREKQSFSITLKNNPDLEQIKNWPDEQLFDMGID